MFLRKNLVYLPPRSLTGINTIYFENKVYYSVAIDVLLKIKDDGIDLSLFQKSDTLFILFCVLHELAHTRGLKDEKEVGYCAQSELKNLVL